MNWQQIRETHPDNWVVVEAIHAHTEGEQRIIDQLEVAAVFGDDSQAAWKHYQALHQDDRTREYYVLHTSRTTLDIGVLDMFGRPMDFLLRTGAKIDLDNLTIDM